MATVSINKLLENFGLGVLTSAAITPMSLGVAFLAKSIGLIQGEYQPTPRIEEVVKQWNKKLIDTVIFNDLKNGGFGESICRAIHLYNATHVKIEMAASVGIIIPIIEESLFRGIIQELLLTRLPKSIIKQIRPDKEDVIDTTVAKVMRIIVTASLFSLIHLRNRRFFNETNVQLQLVITFVLGIGLGALKESKPGLLGSIGLHMAHNMLVLSPVLFE